MKDQVQGDISAVNEAIVSEDADKIEEALERLKNSSLEIGKAIYAQSSDDSGASEEQPAEEEEKTEEAEQKEESADGEKKEEEKK